MSVLKTKMFKIKHLLVLSFALGISISAFGQDKLRILASPNPNIFPLLVAMADDPALPVEIIPLANTAEIGIALEDDEADGLLSMTYTAAQKVTSGNVPDLRLVYVGLWKGFSEVTYKDDHIRSLSDLRGKGVIVAGPVGGGKDGAPDMIFQAALRRAGMTAADLNICYLPVMEAARLLKAHALLNSNPKCDAAFDFPASGISLVEPAASGMIMQGMMSFSSVSGMERGIEFQPLFSGFTAWPDDQLPHGGLSVMSRVLADPVQSKNLARVLAAYKAAVDKMNHARGFGLIGVSGDISDGIAHYFQKYRLDLPRMVVMASLRNGQLVFRSDVKASIQGDLNRFLTEVVGQSPPEKFYSLQ